MYGRCNHSQPCHQSSCGREKDIVENFERSLQDLKIKNKRLQGWIRKALRASHKDQIESYEASVKQLQDQLRRTDQQLDTIYDDKLNELIDTETYKRKFDELTDAKKQLEKSLRRYSDSKNKYFELGASIFDLSQKGLEIYEKVSDKRKRELIKLMFTDMKLHNGVIEYRWTKPFQILYEAVKATNSSKVQFSENFSIKNFEPMDNTDKTIQEEVLSPSGNSHLEKMDRYVV